MSSYFIVSLSLHCHVVSGDDTICVVCIIMFSELSHRLYTVTPLFCTFTQVKSFSSLNKTEMEYRFNNYFKVVILRDPINRLVSSYLNKLQSPLNYTNRWSFPDSVKYDILTRYRPKVLKQLRRHSHSVTLQKSLRVTFREFVSYLSHKPLYTYNEHFKPVLDLCHPCAMKYTFYANFDAIEYDVHAVLEHLEIPSAYYPIRLGHPSVPMTDYLGNHFKGLPSSDRERLLTVFGNEMAFYHSVYPKSIADT